MSAHNNFAIIGFLGNDRRINSMRDTGEETGISFSVAVNKRVPDPEKPGEWKDDTNWFWVNLSSKNRSYDYLCKHLLKGAQVAVQGHLNVRHRQIEVRRGNSADVEVQRESHLELIAIDVQVLRYVKTKDGEHNSQQMDSTPPVNFSDEPPLDSYENENYQQQYEDQQV